MLLFYKSGAEVLGFLAIVYSRESIFHLEILSNAQFSTDNKPYG